MATSGIFLLVFLLVHLAGNLLLLKNDAGQAFLHYSESMMTNPVIRVFEIVLLAGFLWHIITGMILTIQNKQARPTNYIVKKSTRNSSWSSRHMPWTGGIIFIFLIIHLKSFFFEHRILGTEHTMYESVQMVFSNSYATVFYIFSMALLSLHLVHGIQSSFQSTGIRHEKYLPMTRVTGYLLAIIIPLLFAIVPIWFYYNPA